ncbi:alpha-ketoglutarate-dependent dioxygenase AlkB family protein [Marixanthomonas spongiae]|uniref:Alpha-ketoglutarate-dependent dioxygenase AlkB n=1 Tax=Marixanthomonas spongiae TaxID=2174845 RepID=A0A2U0I5H4_9FLAO|nr:alpha-ketoglutarate-dependent dioxygenase AlkB [Marixanthomonas spongiae]PVW16349.1 alpha-ketoglutarate-dependent dioxygenase AlkB [Marixanthomonas spongiae]
MDLFSAEEHTDAILLKLPDADVVYHPGFLSRKSADAYFETLLNGTPWQQDHIKIFGKTHQQPRLRALYGEQGKSYSYSGITMHPLPFTSVLKEIKERVEAVSEAHFNVVLLNLYRDGQDSNGWHSDDEKELGENPMIASISLGAERVFQLKHKKDKTLKKSLVLQHGSLLLMKGTTQEKWKHQVPKTKKATTARINLTFRTIK